MKDIFLIFLLSIFSSSVAAESKADPLFDLINERLSHMHNVALYKAHNQLPIENLEREKIVIRRAIESAQQYQFNPDIIEHFFDAQISVAKAIQYRYRADLLAQPVNQPPPDLDSEIRPELIRLGNQIIQEIANYCATFGAFDPNLYIDFDRAVQVKYVTHIDKKNLFNALLKTSNCSH